MHFYGAVLKEVTGKNEAKFTITISDQTVHAVQGF